jgi:hypothetical protein
MFPDLSERAATTLLVVWVALCTFQVKALGADAPAEEAVSVSGGSESLALPQVEFRAPGSALEPVEPGNSMGGVLDGSLLQSPRQAPSSTLDPRLLELIGRRADEANNWLQMDRTAQDPFTALSSSGSGWDGLRLSNEEAGRRQGPESLGDRSESVSARAAPRSGLDAGKDTPFAADATAVVVSDPVAGKLPGGLSTDPAVRRSEYGLGQGDSMGFLSLKAGSQAALPVETETPRPGTGVGSARSLRSVRELIGSPPGLDSILGRSDLIRLTTDDTQREINPSTPARGDGNVPVLGEVPGVARYDARELPSSVRDLNPKTLGPSSLSPVVPTSVVEPEKPRVHRSGGGNKVVIPQRRF